MVKLLLEKGAKKLQIHNYKIFTLYHIFIIITLIERVLGELIYIYSGMLPPDVSSIFQKLRQEHSKSTRYEIAPRDAKSKSTILRRSHLTCDTQSWRSIKLAIMVLVFGPEADFEFYCTIHEWPTCTVLKRGLLTSITRLRGIQ